MWVMLHLTYDSHCKPYVRAVKAKPKGLTDESFGSAGLELKFGQGPALGGPLHDDFYITRKLVITTAVARLYRAS